MTAYEEMLARQLETLKDAIATYRAAWVAYCDTKGPGARERSENINVAEGRMMELAGLEPFRPKVVDEDDDTWVRDFVKAARDYYDTPNSSIARRALRDALARVKDG